MKKLHILLLTSLLIFTFSCSKDDDNPSAVEMGIYKVTFEQSGAYEDYDITYSGNAMVGVPVKNETTGEVGLNTPSTGGFLKDYQNITLSSTEKSVFFVVGFLTYDNERATENMQVKVTYYYDNEIVYTDTLSYTPQSENLSYMYFYDTRNSPKMNKTETKIGS